MLSYSHIVEYAGNDNIISLYRMNEDGEKELFTKVQFPEQSQDIQEFMKMLGETLLLDSPIARKILNL